MKTKTALTITALIFSAFLLAGITACSKAGDDAKAKDPLPSWADGKNKTAIIEFVTRVTDKNSPDYIAPEARVTSFDNDGTLWPEKPVIEGIFAIERMQRLLPSHPEWRDKQPFKALIEGDKNYLRSITDADVRRFLRETHSGATEIEFDKEVDDFFYNGVHPFINRSYTHLAYQPMRELLDYLAANGFRNFLNTAGDTEFARAIAHRMFGIPDENVIGSMLAYSVQEIDGRLQLVRDAKLERFNERENKAVNFRMRTGRHPVIAVGKINNGADVAILRYSKSSPSPSLQILIKHDDPVREYEYGIEDRESLDAAEKEGWLVVSMASDWSLIMN